MKFFILTNLTSCIKSDYLEWSCNRQVLFSSRFPRITDYVDYLSMFFPGVIRQGYQPDSSSIVLEEFNPLQVRIWASWDMIGHCVFITYIRSNAIWCPCHSPSRSDVLRGSITTRMSHCTARTPFRPLLQLPGSKVSTTLHFFLLLCAARHSWLTQHILDGPLHLKSLTRRTTITPIPILL